MLNALKKIKQPLIWGGVGFALSSIVGLDGFRDTIQFSQLWIGMGAIMVAAVLHVMSRCTDR